ncbi:MAG: GNAT family N-acetyltransferase, partial [Nitrososphaerales archaeon]
MKISVPVQIRLGRRSYVFRRALQSDSSRVVLLLHQMFTKPPHGFSEKNALRILKGIRKSGDVYNLVVEFNEEIVANVLAYLVEYPRFGRRMFVEDFVVDQRHRGNGLGSSMLK